MRNEILVVQTTKIKKFKRSLCFIGFTIFVMTVLYLILTALDFFLNIGVKCIDSEVSVS